ncbi:MAG: ABC transporter permease [Lachnospiraceae bacterium]|nr:ABC transporter permease [Lachnospiraceae bacterium]
MKIMEEYTWQKSKQNKKQTISMLIAITIASALLCSLCIFLYSYWQGKVDEAKEQIGYWHGELWDATTGAMLPTVLEDPEVTTVMVKGNWYTAKPKMTKRPYLLMRDADENFWKDMNYTQTVLEGRLPEKQGEIVVSKLFFTDNPEFRVGDELVLPVGKRMLDGRELETRDYEKTGESFEVTETRRLKIVGSIDVSGVSAFPGYIAMGYLDHTDIQPTDELTIYLRVNHPEQIYETLPRIAEKAGLVMDESGKYGVRYNTTLLNLYGITDKKNTGTLFISMIIMAVVLCLLVMGVFVLIIYNTFAISANSRIRELSILKSMGATPKQIRHSVLFEGVILWILQLLPGLVLGYVFSYLVLKRMNTILAGTENYVAMQIAFSPVVLLFAGIFSLVMVLLSARIPANRVGKISVIEGISNPGRCKIPKTSTHIDIYRELGVNQYRQNKKSMKTAILSLTLCFILLVSYANIISIFNMAVAQDEEILNYDLTLQMSLMEEPDPELLRKIKEIPQVQDICEHREVRTTTYVTGAQESAIFKENGGLEGVDAYKYNVVKEGEQYRIVTYLVGLEEESFEQYCDKIGISADHLPDSVLVDSTYHMKSGTKETVKIPMLQMKPGDVLSCREKVFDDMDGNYEFSVQVGAVTEEAPGILDTSRYSLALILPMKDYEALTRHFSEDRKLEANSLSIDLLAGVENSAGVKEQIMADSTNYMGSEDFTVWSRLEEEREQAISQQAIRTAVYAVAVMIAVIGIFNTFSTITNNIRVHKKEYALFRSAGMTASGLHKVFLLEGCLFAVSPIVIGMPVILVISGMMLRITLLDWGDFIKVMPARVVLMYVLGIFMAVFCAYAGCAKRIVKENMIEAIEDDTM